ncbi:CPBP family intramembrane metalloprotease [Temperatibacter marinus]|uniref:CPBP family intramembrane metalloprotease n=1 Tax=Temperatibacter marinus TaxID=1456591 RepID=A0AA52EIM7_9PROT|nr:CPBP family intramembrane glutamic endopeptidase [Temperatibacter marinus]WND03843.1 CPBP family intramembrane metalloprotease [Temperatibacter marinus]
MTVLSQTPTVLFEGFPPAKRHNNPWIMLLLLFAFFILAQIITIVPLIESGLIDEDHIEVLEQYPNILYMLFATFLTTFVLLWLWVRFYEGTTLKSVGLTLSGDSSYKYGRGLLYGLGMSGTVVLLIYLTGGFVVEKIPTFTSGNLIAVLILLTAFAVQSGVEEIVFRGWMLGKISAKRGIVAGIAFNTLGFLLLHLLSYDFANNSIWMAIGFSLMLILFSVFTSLITIRDRSVWGACAWHAAWNWFFINGFGVATTGIDLDTPPLFVDFAINPSAPQWISGGLSGPEGSIMALIVLSLACVVALRKKS